LASRHVREHGSEFTCPFLRRRCIPLIADVAVSLAGRDAYLEPESKA